MSSSPSATIQDLVARQFGPQAEAYVASAVHAQGEDLEALARLLEGHGAARLIDLGCGGGHVSFTAAPHVKEVVAYDLSAEMLAAVAGQAARRGLGNIATAQGVAERLPFEDGSFDIVASRYSAHHWADAAAGVREARRMLKPGGLCVFMDVVAAEDALLDTFLQTVEMLRDPSHVRDYAARQWRAFAHGAGFTVESETPRRLRLEYGPWITRIGTRPVHAAAIRSLQEGAPQEVKRHFEIEADGTFTLDTLTLVLKAV
ncbi:class I SAM-dependent methyltransferase [Xanthobacter pseudotagetidis]|uniref:class I SAM-dependent methyltransferase n=1 Tax=Xanthobacter pseudotagetidis TaxID=3119911 RepID=UPI00372723FF